MIARSLELTSTVASNTARRVTQPRRGLRLAHVHETYRLAAEVFDLERLGLHIELEPDAHERLAFTLALVVDVQRDEREVAINPARSAGPLRHQLLPIHHRPKII